jgi:hypothetical protein
MIEYWEDDTPPDVAEDIREWLEEKDKETKDESDSNHVPDRSSLL